MTFIVRKALPSDRDALRELYEENDARHAAGRPDAFQSPPAPGRPLSFTDARLNAPDSIFLVAVAGDRIAGFAFAKLGRAPDDAMHRPRLFAYVEEVVVAAGRRREGIGTALMSNVESWARARGVGAVELIVWEFNEDARRFYESLGYGTSYRRMTK
jgi:GNAT superfamily N-acetyltransferase